jgi:phosphatidate cytidylyltransferase
MADHPSDHPGRPAGHRWWNVLGRRELRAQVKASRADIGRQFEARRAQLEATRAQLEATNERIEARVGRNLPKAILFGLVAGGVALACLLIIKEIFIVVAAAAIALAALELAQAFRGAGRSVARTPAIIAAAAAIPAAYFWHTPGQLIAIAGGILLVWIWRLAESLAPSKRATPTRLFRDLGSAALVQVYVTFLGSFTMLTLSQHDGQWWLLAFLILVIGVDTGAYASGLLFGRHPMAPTISPNKTWEGFAGAAVVSVVAGVILSLFMLGDTWWFGVIFGLVLLITATIGDLTESLIKRDLGIKDMSSWLPGHGGILDRLDSLLPSAAATYALLLIFH